MSAITEKIKRLRALTGLDVRESDEKVTSVTRFDGVVKFPVVCGKNVFYLTLPESESDVTVKLVTAYFADAEPKTALSEVESLLYKAFTGMITADEVVRLGKILPDKKYFVVLLKTYGTEKWAELIDYLGALTDKKDYIIKTDDGEVVYLKTVGDEYGSSEELAEILYAGVTEERKINLVVCSGGTASGTEKILAAYRRTLDAMSSGSGNVRHYRDLAITALMAKAPVKAVKEYYEYLTDGMKLAELDGELKITAKTFLDCGLSCAETAKTLFIHRNTLLNRLDRITALTGLDLRNFREAQLYDYITAASTAINNRK